MKKLTAITLLLLTVFSTLSFAQKVATMEIVGESIMTFGADPDTPFPNNYSLVIKDKAGNIITAEQLPADYSVSWDIDGFKTANDTQGQYCDSYGKFAVNDKASLATVFELRNVPMNFVGNMTAELRLGKQRFSASKYVAALAMPKESKSAGAEDKSQTVAVKAESGCVYDVKVAYAGVLYACFLNEDLSGYELGRQENADTVTYAVPCVNGQIDLRITAENGAAPHIAYVSIEKQQPKQARTKRKVHHIGDSTSANKGSWAHRLLQQINEGEYKELVKLCDFCNDGRGGRNLRTYYIQGHLAKVLCDICPGDIVMIGNNGTNGMNKTFEEDLNHYIDAAEAFGARIILNSYTPHGAVSRWSNGYNAETQRYDSYRRDAYDVQTRKVAEEREAADPSYIGFVEIGMNADAIFNAYVDDYKNNGYESRDAAAQAIISCFADHNHYSNDPLACDLMLNGYKKHPGIVEQLIGLLNSTHLRNYSVSY